MASVLVRRSYPDMFLSFEFDFDPVLLEGRKGNGKSMLRDAIAHDTDSAPHVLLAVQMTEGGIDALNDQLAFVAQCAEADDGVELFVFEEVEEFTHGQQSLIKEVLDDKEYKDKIQFILINSLGTILEEKPLN